MKQLKYLRLVLCCVMMVSGNVCFSQSDMLTLTDEEMASVEGQALFNLSYLAPGDIGNPTVNNSGGTNTGFYTLAMEATVELNLNIKNLQLGCGGINGGGGCDIDGQNVSFGCIANSNGDCISLPKSYGVQPSGKAQEASPGIPKSSSDPTLATGSTITASGNTTQTQLKDFVLNNPFFQFAIMNPSSPSTREVVGFRVGAANVSGPLSFGSLNTFSGYLTGLANLTMRGQGANGTYNGITIAGNLDATQTPDGITDQESVAITCKAPDLCATAGGRSFYSGRPDYRYLNLDDECITIIGICASNLRDLTVAYTTVTRSNLPVTLSGNRQTQALVANTDLGKNTNGGQDGVVKAITNSMAIIESNGLSAGLINTVLGLVRTQAATKITDQLAAGLGTTAASLDNDTYQLPFNVSNVHQLDIASNAFGLSLQKQDLQYPGYTQAVSRGWAMYVPNAFTLTLNRRVSDFMAGIVGSDDARSGNIVALEAPYRNCWGTLTFC